MLKKITFLAVALLNIVPVFSGSAQQIFTISGKITGAAKDFVILSHKDRYNIFNEHDTITLKRDGSFTHKYNLDKYSSSAELKVSDAKIIMIYGFPNKKLILNYTSADNKTAFKGDLARIQEYLAFADENGKQLNQYYSKRNPNYNSFITGSKDFAGMDSVTTDQITALEKYFVNTKSISEKEFLKQQRWNFVFKNLQKKVYFEFDHRKYKYFQEAGKPTSQTFKYSEEIDFNNPQLLLNASYLDFVADCFSALIGSQTEIEPSIANFIPLINRVVDAYSKNILCNHILKIALINASFDSVTDLSSVEKSNYAQSIVGFMKTAGQKEGMRPTLVQLEKHLNKAMHFLDGLKKGKMAPSFQYKDLNGNKIELSSLKGKYIYIDAWFTGCTPCAEVYPYWNKLVDQFKGRQDIAFVSVCFDTGENIWKPWVEKYKIQGSVGISLMFDPEGFSTKYKTNSAPTYILIDKEGKIMDPRADGPKTIDLAKLLAE
ncbi:TlpA family protein disulfide reductase [Pedobacter metabolipauper]|uniref:Thiol-disulfide isomerase/thioredoxin n=1 Tax=Pedobacter metabolipauper TaxID=425513 RepID=A0A4V6PW15_9SPHI|nr:TlpA disulfide reductase family protein [Pedobacter metabolipauper]TDQ09877.1 thiol-disulfide isomerase/thioredoxin [Pedobacter metabolipauper]